MTDIPLVSISCITFNHAPYLRECFDGFLMQQTDFQFEVVVHDDASTDGTREVIEEYTAKYPNIFVPMYQTENQYSQGVRGMMARFNFPRCKGKYIALCEGDDYWTDPLKLQKQVDFLESNPDYIIHSAKAQILEDGVFEKFIGNPLLKNTYKLEDFIAKNNLITCTVLFKNVKFDFNKFKNVTFGDWLLYVLLLQNNSTKLAYASDEVYSIYRVHKGGVMQTLLKKQDNMLAHLNQINIINKIVPTKYTIEDHKLINFYCTHLFKDYVNQKSFGKALRVFINNFYLVKFKLVFKSYVGIIIRKIF